MTTTEDFEHYAEIHLACRDLRHRWEVEGYWREAGEVRRSLSCQRCQAVRTDHWTPDGKRLHATYSYPKGYKVPGGISYRGVRQEVLRRVTVYATEAEMMQSLFGGERKRGAA